MRKKVIIKDVGPNMLMKVPKLGCHAGGSDNRMGLVRKK